MSLDGFAIMALVHELNNQLINIRIDKIHQPHKYEIMLQIRANKEKFSLLLSANPESPRIHSTQHQYINPETAPMFCMLLRKYLSHGKIMGVSQPGIERIVIINIENNDEVGDLRSYELILEIMGRHSNLILVDKENKNILGCMKYITNSISRLREVLPGIPYETPPTQNKFNPFLISENTFTEIFFNIQSPKALWKVFLEHVAGMSPQMIKETIYRAHLSPSTQTWNRQDISSLWEVLQSFIQKAHHKNFEPMIIMDQEIPKFFSPFPLEQYEEFESRSFPSMNQATDYFFWEKQQILKLREKKHPIEKIVRQHLNRFLKKYSLQQKAFNNAQQNLGTQKLGELITANLYQIDPGLESIEVIDYYDPQQKKISISMNPNLSPIENAQRYFACYAKAKHTIAATEKLMFKNKLEINYLDGILVNIEEVHSLEELAEIKRELIKGNYIKKVYSKSKKKAEKSNKPIPPLHIISEDQWDIYVGRNNHQNDMLTFKIAEPHDLWFHTKDIPGSHVIIKVPSGKEVPDSTIKEAALLAARHSKAKHDTKVPVDYTFRKYVRKPKGAKPGFVLYDHHQNILVNPQE